MLPEMSVFGVVAEVFTADPAHVASTHPAAEVASTAGRHVQAHPSGCQHLPPPNLSNCDQIICNRMTLAHARSSLTILWAGTRR
jgi:hypothetical protein